MYTSRSRYVGLATTLLVDGDGRETPFTPALRRVARAADAAVLRPSSADRPDLIAGRACGDPTLFWRVADVNAIVDPADLTRRWARGLRLPAGD